ncbi:MAG: Smr/MutS family protein [Vicinamibacteria bacterium]
MTPSPLTNASSLKALEWGSVCALLVRRSARLVNQEFFTSFPPGGASRSEVTAILAQVEGLRILLEDGALPFSGIPEVGDTCGALAIKGEYVDGPELLALARFATASSGLGRDVQSRLGRRSLPVSRFVAEAADLARIGDLSFVRSVERAIGPKGEVRDDASPELRRLRARTHRLREDLDLVFDSYLRDPKASDVLQDKVVASRNGRSVLMVKAEARRSFEGVVHGASRAQKTAFIEPIEAVAVNNELVVVSEEEQEEIRQILRRLSDEAREDLGALQRTEWIVCAWDALHARARLGHDLGGRSPEFSEDGALVIVKGVHPLLVDRIRADLELAPSGREPVPLDLEVGSDRRILVIGGPNTGGKTVALKTVGLCCLMARSALPVPAGEGTLLPFFDSIFAEIGDDQSLGAGLSTFSAQIAGIAKMTIGEGARSLVLLDELGSGTDPLEGGALGAAVIDDFAHRGATVIATTHNADLKLFAQESPLARCASFAYDPASFAPTYKLVLNQPGRSLAFEIASRLGVPAAVVDQARARLPESARRQEAILADLAREKAELAQSQEQVRDDQAKVRDLRETLQTRLNRIEDERERMREDTRERIVKRREAEDQRLRSLFADAEEKLKNAKTPRAVARLRGEVLSQVTPESERRPDPAVVGTLAVGDFVEAPSLGWRGLITALTDSDVEIDSSGKRIRLGRSMVQRAKNPKASPGPPRWPGAGRSNLDAAEAFASKRAEAKGDSLARSEGGSGGEARRGDESCGPPLKIIGMRVDEAMPLVDKFLDDAFLADAPAVRIIHGFGQGRLRAAVRDLVKSHPHVTGFRDGASNEGGAGATIVELRR